MEPKNKKEAWAEGAFDILADVAKQYHGVIEYTELGQAIQERTGVSTRMAIRNWIGGVLEIVVHRCQTEGLPALTSLVVRKDSGMVGDGYDAVLKAEGTQPLDDVMQREEHAAYARLECYRWAKAAGLPADGGTPALAPKLAAKVSRQRKLAPRPLSVCPSCNMALPATGRCDNCH